MEQKNKELENVVGLIREMEEMINGDIKHSDDELQKKYYSILLAIDENNLGEYFISVDYASGMLNVVYSGVRIPEYKSKLNVGDTVYLKSGGLPMTYVGKTTNGIICKWHSLDGLPCTEIYPPESLTFINPSA